MGLMPDEYYNMLPVDFKCMMNGHIKRINRESSDKRRAAFLICRMLGYNKGMDQFAQMWPLIDDVKQDDEKIESPEIEYWNKIKKQNKRISNTYRNKKKR